MIITDTCSPFPIDCLGTILSKAALIMRGVIGAPIEMCGQSVLAGANLAVQRLYDVQLDGRRYPTSEYFLTIALQNERKSELDKVALAAVESLERDLRKKHKNDMRAYRLRIKDDSDAVPPAPAVLKVTDMTISGVLAQFSQGCPALGLFNDEAGAFFGGWGMKEDNRLHTIATMSQLWTGRPVTQVRRGEGRKGELNVLANRRLCAHVQIQPVVAMPVLNDPLMQLQGYLSRFLSTWPVSTQGTRAYNDTDIQQHADMQAYYDRISLLLKQPVPENPDLPGELTLGVILVDDDAKDLWIAAYNKIEKQLGPGGQLVQIRGFAGKAAEHCLRIAATLAAFELDKPVITAEIMRRAIDLTTWYLNERARIIGISASEEDAANAESLYEWLCKKYTTSEGFTTANVYQNGPPGMRSATPTRRALFILQSKGLVESVNDDIWVLSPVTE